jgi:photosystem II stability/assembly factor-like uncharacterized protein
MPRNFDLTGEEHGAPTLLGVSRAARGSTVYASSRSGIVYQSDTRGTRWKRFGRGVEGIPCGLLAIDRKTPTTMFAGNGDEIARSVDAGSHWSMIKLPHSSRATSVAIQPSDSRHVFAWGVGGAHGGLTPGPPPGGMFASKDGGLTWQKIADYEAYEDHDVALAAPAPATLYIATPAGLFQTADGGDSWRELTRGLPHPNHGPDDYDFVTAAPTTAAVAFAAGSFRAADARRWIHLDRVPHNR